MGYTLITGASGGIGMELAKVCASHGHNLILVARREHRLLEVKEKLVRHYKIKVMIIEKDLAQENGVKEIFAYLQEKKVKVTILINNAGVGDQTEFLDSDWDKQKAMLDLNITALMEMTYLFGKEMKKNGYGRILNLSSMASFCAGPYMAIYYASKAFVRSFSEAVAEELKGTGVTVTALCPGPTSTGFEKAANMVNSRMFSVLKPASAKAVARSGYKAMMRGKVLKYHGLPTQSINILSRIIPRSISRKCAMIINQSNDSK